MKPEIKTIYRNKKIKRLEPQKLPSKEWIKRYAELQTINLQEKVIKWCLATFAVSLLCTFVIYLLEGFHWFGFALPTQLLCGLGFYTAGQMAGLIMVTFKFLFKTT